jgi:hypothetical protein
MNLSVDELNRLAAEVAHATSPTLEVIGVSVGRGSGYSEVLVTVRGCRVEPCQVAVGVFRDEPVDVLRNAILRSLRRHLDEHPPA